MKTPFREKAIRFCTDYGKALSPYLAAKNQLDQATADYKAIKDSMQSTPKEVGDAWEVMKASEEAFRNDRDSVKAECHKLRRTFREEMEQAISRHCNADPSGLDRDFINLAESGILTPSEWADSFDRFKGNATMQRWVERKVSEMEPNASNAPAINRAKHYAANESSDALNGKVDVLLKSAERFTCSEWSEHWGRQSEFLCEEF